MKVHAYGPQSSKLVLGEMKDEMRLVTPVVASFGSEMGLGVKVEGGTDQFFGKSHPLKIIAMNTKK